MAGKIVVDTIQSDSSYASRINVTSNVAFTSPVNFTGGMQIGGQDATFGGMRNRVINGDMRIDQRNSGSSVTLLDGAAAYSFVVDRFACSRASGATATAQQSTNAPAGFTNSLLITNGTGISVGSTAQAYITHFIEGLNIADLGWGTANAQPVTLSFWVRSSITGTHSGAVFNSDWNRSYPFTYTINSANTWEKETITIPGDTTGTWLTTTGRGIIISFNNGSGSSYLGTAGAWGSAGVYGVTGSVALNSVTGSTWQITGVQFEKGSAASAFEYRHYGQELALCQRYFQNLTFPSSGQIATGITWNTTSATARLNLLQEMRATPTITLPTAGQTAGTISFLNNSGYPAATGTHSISTVNSQGFQVVSTNYTGLAGSGYASWFYVGTGATASFLASAEL